MSPLELAAAGLTLVSVFLAVREDVWTWPVGVVSVVLYAVVFWQQRLHALAGLQVVFLVTQLYGWFAWARGVASRPLPVRRTSPRLATLLALLGLGGTAAIGAVLLAWPPAEPSPPWRVGIDAGLTAFSLVAQWMLARKLLENWLVWIAVDVVSVGFFVADGLYPSAALYAILGGLCVLGWRRWRREGVA